MKIKLKYWIAFIFIVSFMGLLIALLPGDDAIGITGLAFLFLFLFIFSQIQPYPELRQVIIIAFILRVTLALVHAFVLPLPDSQTDALNFEQAGWELARGWHNGEPFTIITGSYFYSFLIGIIYFITDRSPLLIQAVNVLLGSLIVYNTGVLARILYNPTIAATAAWIACFFPALLLYSAITMREALIVFFLSLSVIHIVQWLKNERSQHLIQGTAYLFISGLSHTGILFLMIIPVIFLFYSLLKTFLKGRVNALIIKTLAAILVCALVSLPLATGAGLQKIDDLQRLTSIEYLEEVHRIRAHDRAAYLTDLSLSGPASLITLVPLKTLYFLFAPFPWQASAPRDIAGVLDGMFYLLFTGLSCYGLYRVRRESSKTVFWGILMLLGAGIIIFAMGTGNYGAALRQRAKFVFIMIALAGPAVAGGRQKLKDWLQRRSRGDIHAQNQDCLPDHRPEYRGGRNDSLPPGQ